MEFDLVELLTTYIEYFRDPDLSPKDKLAYGRAIDALIEKIHTYNGLFAKTKTSREIQDDDGNTYQQSVETNFLGTLDSHKKSVTTIPESRFIRPREEK